MNSINNVVKSLNKYLIIGKIEMNYADVENMADDNFNVVVTIAHYSPYSKYSCEIFSILK